MFTQAVARLRSTSRHSRERESSDRGTSDVSDDQLIANIGKWPLLILQIQFDLDLKIYFIPKTKNYFLCFGPLFFISYYMVEINSELSFLKIGLELLSVL